MANVSDKVAQIRQAVYGKDVRESIASGIEAINTEVESTTARQDSLETTFDQLIINAGNSNAEVVDARVKADNTVYPTLRDRLNDVDSQLADIANNKVDKVAGKGLSTNDYDNTEKAEVAKIKDKADKVYVDNQLSLKANITYVDTQIANIGNASPKGVYATLSDLQTAYPTGTTGIYVVTEDGKWYYWNGSTWTAGGVYQSSGIAPGSITPDMLKYGGIYKNKGFKFPFVGPQVVGASPNNDKFVVDALLDIKIFGAVKDKKYKIVFFGNNSTTWGDLLVIKEYNADLSNSRQLVPAQKVTRTLDRSGINTYIVTTNDVNISALVTIDYSVLPSPYEFYCDESRFGYFNDYIHESCYIYEPIILDRYGKIPSSFLNTLTPMYVRYNPVDKRTIIASKYNKDKDLWLTILPCGCSLLPQLHNMYLVDNTQQYVNGDLSNIPSTPWYAACSDWVGPYFAPRAVNNADGDNPDSYKIMGGWHGYNGDQTGAATATNLKYEVYADNVLISGSNDITVGANIVKVVVVNNIKGSNTVKADGTGRDILQERITYTFNCGEIYIDAEITALEDMSIQKYYGIQTNNGNWNNSCFYVDDPEHLVPFDPKNVTVLGATKANGNKCHEIHLEKDGHRLEAFIVDGYGLGRLDDLGDNYYPVHTQSYGKSYFYLLSNKNLIANQKMFYRGGYRFYYKRI